MTPCEERGWKVGDRFVVISRTDSVAERGDVVELLRDDGDEIPYFRCEGEYETYLDLGEVDRIEEEDVPCASTTTDKVMGKSNWNEFPAGTTHYHVKLGWIKRTPLIWYYWGGNTEGCGWVQIGDQENFENECVQDLISRPLEPDMPMKQPVKSDGLSSSYYTIPLSDQIIERINETKTIETEDIIKCGFNNDFDFGNALKSLKRLYECVNGGGKEGNDMRYEINKIKYSLDKIERYYSD